MSDICSITLTGNLGKDPQLSQVGQNQTDVARFSIANGSRRGQQDHTSWFTCDVWGRQAQTAAQYLRKGMKVAVTGDLKIEQYTDRDGIERTAAKIDVRSFQMLDRPQQQQQQAPQQRQPQQNRQQPNSAANNGANGVGMPADDGFDDDIPF